MKNIFNYLYIDVCELFFKYWVWLNKKWRLLILNKLNIFCERNKENEMDRIYVIKM